MDIGTCFDTVTLIPFLAPDNTRPAAHPTTRYGGYFTVRYRTRYRRIPHMHRKVLYRARYRTPLATYRTVRCITVKYGTVPYGTSPILFPTNIVPYRTVRYRIDLGTHRTCRYDNARTNPTGGGVYDRCQF